ncbi:type 4a pilus biogenesis protein PilO [Candidatus Parcubacteria bacterium]|nr:type 4a pilus biogenesis protein PilO [Candidatus Parcubacteria bacterium]
MNRFIFTIIAILLSAVVGFVLAYPKYQIFEQKKAEVESKETELQNIEEHFSQVNATVEQLKDYEEELVKINTALPAEASIPTLLDFLKATVKSRGLLLQNLSTDFVTSFKKDDNSFNEENIDMGVEEELYMEEEESLMGTEESSTQGEESSAEETIKEIEINLTVFGSYELFKALLADLEESARLIEIRDISFSYSAIDRNGYLFNLNLKTHSY